MSRKNILKKLTMSAAMALAVAACSGCGGEALTAEEFQSTMEEAGLEVIDQTDSASDDSYQQILVAIDEEKYSLEYYDMASETAAQNVYAYAVNNLNESVEEYEDAEVTDNGTEYIVNTDDYWVDVSYKGNIVLYVTAYPDYIEEAEGLIEETGF